MRMKTKSFLKRIASGGVLAAGIALLLSTGCDLALDEEVDDDEDGLVDYADDDAEANMGDDHEPMPTRAGEGDLIAICHFGPTMMQSDSEDMLVTESELPAHLGHGDVFGTCADFFCGAS